VRENLREYMRRLSARPHPVGSPYDKENAGWILSKFREWGSTRTLKHFQVLFPTRKNASSNWLHQPRFARSSGKREFHPTRLPIRLRNSCRPITPIPSTET